MTSTMTASGSRLLAVTVTTTVADRVILELLKNECDVIRFPSLTNDQGIRFCITYALRCNL